MIPTTTDGAHDYRVMRRLDALLDDPGALSDARELERIAAESDDEREIERAQAGLARVRERADQALAVLRSGAAQPAEVPALLEAIERGTTDPDVADEVRAMRNHAATREALRHPRVIWG